jgi:hypothetical protein
MQLNAGPAGPPHPYDRRWYLHLNNNTHGPYTGHQIRLMVKQHKVVASDLAYAEDSGSAWHQIANDPILGALFKNNADARRSRRFRKWLFVIPVLVIAGWIGWPYYNFYKLAVAFRAADVPALESGVAWDSVRQGLRSDLNAAMGLLLSTAANTGNSTPLGAAMFTGLAGVMVPAMLNQLVDGYVTPQAIAAVNPNKDGAPKENATNRSLAIRIQSVGGARWDQVEYMFFSGDPFTFKVQVRPEHDLPFKSPFTLIFNWSGRWKLTRIILPSDAFDALSTAAKNAAPASELDTNQSAIPEPAPPAVAAISPAPTTTARAVLYEDEANDPVGKIYTGSATWGEETVSPGSGLEPELQVHAVITIPERNMSVTWNLRRNTDQALPASHIIEIIFNLPPDFPGAGVANVPGVLMKESQQARGVPLAGLAVKVTYRYFMIGLSAVDADASTHSTNSCGKTLSLPSNRPSVCVSGGRVQVAPMTPSGSGIKGGYRDSSSMEITVTRS